MISALTSRSLRWATNGYWITWQLGAATRNFLPFFDDGPGEWCVPYQNANFNPNCMILGSLAAVMASDVSVTQALVRRIEVELVPIIYPSKKFSRGWREHAVMIYTSTATHHSPRSTYPAYPVPSLRQSSLRGC